MCLVMPDTVFRCILTELDAPTGLSWERANPLAAVVIFPGLARTYGNLDGKASSPGLTKAMAFPIP